MKENGFLFIAGSKSAVIFQLEKEVFHKIPLVVSIMINYTRFLCVNTARNDNDSTTGFHPFYKLVAVIALVCEDQFALQIESLQQLLRQTDVVAVPAGEDEVQRIAKTVNYRVDFRRQASPASSDSFVSPFLGAPC